jgi:hypothetical protein
MKHLKIPFCTFFISPFILFVNIPLSSCNKSKQTYDIQSGLVAYYNFKNGNLSDGSGFHNDITFNNATLAADRFGNANNAYAFDGATTYMTVSNSASLNPNNITLYAIIKINGFNSAICHENQIIGKGSPDVINGFYSLRFDDWPTTCVSPARFNNEYFYGQFGDNNPQGSTTGQLLNLLSSRLIYGIQSRTPMTVCILNFT